MSSSNNIDNSNDNAFQQFQQQQQQFQQQQQQQAEAGMAPRQDFKTKFSKKMARDPMVPLGTVAAFGVLFAGLGAFYKKDSHALQRFMRARVFAQGVTVAALGVGAYFGMTGQPEEERNSDKHV
eukprot:TRINITY_DN60445_c0_g1_i1.p3 TRINITY_DN60445_c0_g1~~TRINITY_DN60445_c0_g1_i1.p3  ORF type:complete len:124 (+),score=85.36 TRINITY_DN60445_c0_g1_i1:184-555(+)